jgi:cytoskeletal protein CcmA (bactofilin family)
MNIPGGSFGRLTVDGVITIDGDLEASGLELDGVFTCKGNLRTPELNSDGIATIEGNLYAKSVDIDGILTLNGTKFEADRIKCDGILRVSGQISADEVEADGLIAAKEIVGGHIAINSLRKSIFFMLWLRFKEVIGKENYSRVDLIEATSVSLENVHAKQVNGHDVSIGRGCRIERVDCDGKLSIDPEAQVKEVVGG